VRAFDVAIEPRRPRRDVDVMNAQISEMPMELCLESVAVVGANGMDPEREL